MKAISIMLLRVSIGLLVLLWGIDKIVDVEHGLAVSNRFYFGAFSSEALLMGWGAVQVVIGGLAVVGLLRKYVYPALVVINTATLLVVWRSILDPWGWYLEGTNVLFFPSFTVAAGSLLLWAFQDADTLSLDASRQRPAASPARTEPAQPAGY